MLQMERMIVANGGIGPLRVEAVVTDWQAERWTAFGDVTSNPPIAMPSIPSSTGIPVVSRIPVAGQPAERGAGFLTSLRTIP
jgi:hypothetical protein